MSRKTQVSRKLEARKIQVPMCVVVNAHLFLGTKELDTSVSTFKLIEGAGCATKKSELIVIGTYFFIKMISCDVTWGLYLSYLSTSNTQRVESHFMPFNLMYM